MARRSNIGGFCVVGIRARRCAWLALAVVPVAGICLPRIAVGATDTWNGSFSANWADAANWTPAAVPASGDSLIFDGTNTTSIDNITGLDVAGINFATTAGAFSLSGNPFIFGPSTENSSGAVSTGIVNNSSNAETIGMAMTIATGNELITTASGSGQLNLSGTITRQADATVQFAIGGGAINVSGSGLTNDASGIIGGWATIGLGNNTGDWATVNGSGNIVAYTGYTNFAGGTSITGTGNTTNVKINTRSSTAVTVNAGTAGTYDMNTLSWNTGTANPAGNQAVNLASGQIVRFGANGAIMNVHAGSRTLTVGNGQAGSAITAGGAPDTNGELSLYAVPFTNGNQRLSINAPVNNNGLGVVSVNTLGDVVLRQPSTFSGGLNVVVGRVQANILGAFGTGTIDVFPGGEAFPWDSGAADTYTNNWILAGYGSNSQDPFALRVGVTGTETFTGNISLPSTAVLGIASSAAGGGLLTTGPISGAGGLTVTGGYNTGTLILGQTAPNTYQGDTTIDSSLNGNNITISFVAGSNNVMPNGAGTGNLVIVGAGTHVSTFDLNGTQQTINALNSSGAVSGNAIVTSSTGGGVLTLGANNASGIYTGTVTGGSALAITKIGTGTQILGGPVSYTGDTNVNRGTLMLAGTIGNLFVGSGNASISPGTAAGSIGTLNVTGLTFNAGGDYQVDATTGNVSDVINASTVAFNAAATISPSAAAVPGTYTIITSGSAISYGVTPTVNAPTNTRDAFALDTSNPNALLLDVTGFVANLTWNPVAGGGDGTTWNVAGAANWNDSSAHHTFFNGDMVTFDNTAPSSNTTITVNSTVQPGSITVAGDSAHNYTFTGNGSIGGPGVLVKNGAGTLTLNTANTFAGGTSLNNGQLNINNASAIGTGPLMIAGGSIDNTSGASVVLSTNNPQTWSSDITFVGSNSLDLGTGAVTLSGSHTITVNGGTLSVGGAISDGNTGASLTKAGPGILFLKSGNTFGGGLTISAGTVEAGGTGGGTGLGSGNVTINANGTLIGAGTDSFGYTAGLAPASLIINGGTVTDLPTSSYRVTLPDIHFTNGGLLTNAAANNGDGNGQYSLFSGTVESDASSSTAVINAGKVALQNQIVTFTVAQGNVTTGPTPGVDLLVTSVLINWSSEGTVVKNGPGVMELTGNSTFTGGTALGAGAVINAGILLVGSTGALGTGNITFGGGTLQYSAGSQVDYSTKIVNSSSPIMIDTNGQSVTYAGAIAGTNSAGLMKLGAGVLLLNGANAFGGDTTVSGGELQVGATGSLPSGNIFVAPAATFTLLTSGSLPANPNLTDNGTANLNSPTLTLNALNSTSPATLNVNATQLTVNSGGSFIGTIQDGGAGGSLVVGAGSTLTTDAVNVGTLSVNGTEMFRNNTIRTLSKVSSLTLAGTMGYWMGALDMTNSRLIVEDTSGNRTTDIASYKDMVVNNGNNTVGIFSSTAAAANLLAGRTDQVVAVVDNAVRMATFPSGSTNFGSGTNNVDANSILITATYLGDANLDGQVNILDLQDLANHWQQNVTDWSQGDFNGDGIVNILDLQALANHWQFGVGTGNGSGESFSDALSTLPAFGGAAATPEPASLALLGLGGVVLASRRRNNK